MVRPPSLSDDPLATLCERARRALALLDGMTIQPHPAASTGSRRKANQASFALEAAQRDLRRLLVLLTPR